MTLTELDALTAAQLPVRDLADHLRLGTGFADDGSEDAVLETYLRAAISAIEVRCSKALIARRFSWVATGWRDGARAELPVGPVTALESATVYSASGDGTVLDLARFSAEGSVLDARGALPTIPTGARFELVFEAGYGADWASVPGGLVQAVRLLAASYFEHRTGAGQAGDLPFAVDALIAPYRVLRVGGGAA